MVSRGSRSRSRSPPPRLQEGRGGEKYSRRISRSPNRPRERYDRREGSMSPSYRSRRPYSDNRARSPARRDRGRYSPERGRNNLPAERGPEPNPKEGRGFNRGPPLGDGGYFQSRQEERNSSKITFWPDSDQISSTSDESDHKQKKAKKRLGSDSEEDSKSRKSKSKKKSKSRKSKKSHSRRSDSLSPELKRHSRRSDSLSPELKRPSSKPVSASNKDIQSQGSLPPHVVTSNSEIDTTEDGWAEKRTEKTEDMIIGPLPATVFDQKIDSRSYGTALLAGEAEAMAAYVQSGKRIPRRGEIGLQSEQIETFEKQGFVMSGSRHQRMNAVRIRKENQIISAEEKRAILTQAQEERAKRESKIIADLREMVNANRTEE